MNLFKVMETSFDSFDETIKTYLAKSLNGLGIEYTHSQIFGVIFDGIKGVIQNAMFYIEDALTEQNIFTATRKKSVYSLARMSGYEPYYGSAAVGTVLGTVVLNNGQDNPSTKVYIKNRTTLVNKTTGIKYSIMLPTDYYVFDISKPFINHEFKIIEGSWATSMFTSKGETMEVFNIRIQSEFDKDYIEVYVDGEKWSRAACLYDMTQDSKEYVVNTGFDSTIEVMFGNGTYGKKLNMGQNIQVDYLTHHGSLGNVPIENMNANFAFDQHCYDGFGASVDANQYIILKNNNVVSGGNNSDTIENVRKMVQFRQQNLLGSFSLLGKFDIVFCRHVLIYFSTDVKQQIISNFAKLLNPGGYLFLGSSEYLPPSITEFEMLRCNPGIVFRKKDK